MVPERVGSWTAREGCGDNTSPQVNRAGRAACCNPVSPDGGADRFTHAH
jgi:hypothetical protein